MEAFLAEKIRELSPADQAMVKTAENACGNLAAIRQKMRENVGSLGTEESQAIAEQYRLAAREQQDTLLAIRAAAQAAFDEGDSARARALSEAYKKIMGAVFQLNAEPSPPPVGVIISEVCYAPEDGAHEWIELTNISQNPIKLAGWYLTDGQRFRVVLSAEIPALEPREYLIVRLDGIGAGPAVEQQSGKGVVVVHTEPGVSGDVLGDGGGHLALYAGDLVARNTIRSYVAWGRSPGAILEDALRANIWDSPGDVVSGTPGSAITMGAQCVRAFESGATIGILGSHASGSLSAGRYRLFSKAEASPGRENRIHTLGFSPLPVILGDDGTFLVQWEIIDGQKVQYHIQIFHDPECSKMQEEGLSSGTGYRSTIPIGRKEKRYCRVRASLPDGSFTVWSEVLEVPRSTR